MATDRGTREKIAQFYGADERAVSAARNLDHQAVQERNDRIALIELALQGATSALSYHDRGIAKSLAVPLNGFVWDMWPEIAAIEEKSARTRIWARIESLPRPERVKLLPDIEGQRAEMKRRVRRAYEVVARLRQPSR